MQTDGHLPQPPFPQVDVSEFVHGLKGVLGVEDKTTTAPPATATDQNDPIPTTSEKQPEDPAPVPTTETVKDSPELGPGTTSVAGNFEHRMLI